MGGTKGHGQAETTKGEQRSVKLEAEEEEDSKTDVRILQPPKKKVKENMDDH